MKNLVGWKEKAIKNILKYLTDGLQPFYRSEIIRKSFGFS